MGLNLGLLSLLGQDSINCGVTYTPEKKVMIATDIDNMRITISLPNWTLKPAVALEITKTAVSFSFKTINWIKCQMFQKNEKVFESALFKEGPMALKVTLYIMKIHYSSPAQVNGFATIMTPNMPVICTSDKPTCQW